MPPSMPPSTMPPCTMPPCTMPSATGASVCVAASATGASVCVAAVATGAASASSATSPGGVHGLTGLNGGLNGLISSSSFGVLGDRNLGLRDRIRGCWAADAIAVGALAEARDQSQNEARSEARTATEDVWGV
eukprot:5313950-Pyramimonas_sp.AAC.1